MYEDAEDFHRCSAEAYAAEEDHHGYEQADYDGEWYEPAPLAPSSSRSSKRSQRRKAVKSDRHPPGLLPIRYHPGVPLKAPSYRGHTDKYTFHEFDQKVDIGVVRSETCRAASEQGLLLLDPLSQ